MQLWFLGTGAGTPSKQRNVSAIALSFAPERASLWLFDCGEGTQLQFLHTPLKLPRLEKVFITHLHGDHLFGLPGLLGSRAMQGAERPLTVYGPPGLRGFVEACLTASSTRLPYTLEIEEISPGEVCANAHVRVTATPLHHGVTSYGYRIEEQPRPGRLHSERLAALGVPPGPWYGQLKRGEPVVWNGQQLHPADFTHPPQPGRVVVVCGDTAPCAAVRELAAGADVLVHEATYLRTDAALAQAHRHSTAADAAAAAAAAGVRTLVLTHVSPRYSQDAAAALLAEARAVFPASHLAHDLWQLDVPRPAAD
ncbi:MAG: ribonuclease Z [Alicyclobacillus sp.]|nr:ribonuclease Z [Alicyclobacillus sp.]